MTQEMKQPIHIISLGAGVQSSTMALMAAQGEIKPMPECAIFADTGAESAATYKQVDYLIAHLPFPVHVVSGGNLLGDLLSGNKRASNGRPPFFVKTDDGPAGRLNRQCTGDYKIDPIRRKVRQLTGLTRKKSPDHVAVVQWIGISVDEVVRAKDSNEPWRLHRFPLLEVEFTRERCIEWLKENGHPIPPNSACVFCPYLRDAQREEMKRDDPAAFETSVLVDETIRDAMPGVTTGRAYVHPSLTPLAEIDFNNPPPRPTKKSTANQWQSNLFLNECEGICGV